MIPERRTAAAPAGDESNAEDKFNNLPDEKFSSTFTSDITVYNKSSRITFYTNTGVIMQSLLSLNLTFFLSVSNSKLTDNGRIILFPANLI